MIITYRNTDTNTIIGIHEDGSQTYIGTSMSNGYYNQYLSWLSQGNSPEFFSFTENPSPKWKNFLKDLRETSTFGAMRASSRLDIYANALATEIRTELGEAALGISTEGHIQPLLDELVLGLSTSQIGEISDLISLHNIPLYVGIGST